MKKLSGLIATVLVFVFQVSLFARGIDTVYVPAGTTTGEYYVNSLIDYVAADTNALGEQQHKVYKLENSKLYVLDKALELKNPVELVADAPVPYDPDKKPPKILSDITGDGEAATYNLIITQSDITIKNIWISGITVDGGDTRGWGLGNALAIEDSFVTVTIDGLWLDYNGWAAIATHYPHTRWHINRLHARNEQNPGDAWTPFLFYLDNAAVVDTFIITNSTYFQSNSFFFFPPRVVQYFKVDHCTFANTLKWPFHSDLWLKVVMTNNIFYNVGSLSLTDIEAQGTDPDPDIPSIIDVDTLYANEIHSPFPPDSYTIPESERVFIVRNNCYFWSEPVQSYLGAHDSVNPPLWMNDRTRAMFDADDTYPNFIDENNRNVDPEFEGFAGLAGADALLAQVCTDFRSGYMHQWDWDSDKTEYPDMYTIMYEYPLAEYFKSYAGLTGTDGLPIGDLSYDEYNPPTGVMENINSRPTAFKLFQNYPNPFNPETTIHYYLPKKSHVKLNIYNVLGRTVRTLINSNQHAGHHSLAWDGSDNNGLPAGSGVYLYVLQCGNIVDARKMILMR